MKPTLQCHKCKQQFRREELVDYTTVRAQNSYKYCPSCLKLVQTRERFDNEISKIFGIKKADEKINNQRKRLVEQGYTDDTIIDCLHYVYEVENIPKITPTLYYVNPEMINKMIKYKQEQVTKGGILAQAINTSFNKLLVPIKKEENKKKPDFDFDSFFDD